MGILITGATGLVGQRLVALCRAQHISVNYLTTRKNQIVTEEGCRGFYWNPDSGEIDLDCFNGVTAIINLAGAPISKRWTPNYKRKILSSRIHSLQTLHRALKTLANNSITSFVSASAIGIYPNSLSKFYEEDEQEVDWSFLGDVTQAWEEEIDTFGAFNCKVAKLRIGLVLSAEGGALPQMAGPINNYVGAAFGSGNQWQSWIHIEDLGRMFLFILENELEGTFNGVGPNPVTNSKLTKEIANVLNKPLLLPNIPQFVMRALLGEMSYLLFASQRVSSKKIEEEGFVFENQNIRRSLENLFTDQQLHKGTDQKYSKEFV